MKTTMTTTMTTTATTTMKKLIAGACLISVSACSASGMSLGLGAGVAVAGGALIASRQDEPSCDPHLPYGCAGNAPIAATNELSLIAGVALLGFGTLLMGLGAWGIAEEHPPSSEPRLALVSAEPAAPPSSAPSGQPAAAAGEAKAARAADGGRPPSQTPPAEAGFASPSTGASAEAELQKLSIHIQLAARANRCDAAIYMLNRLRRLDQPHAISLIRSDEHLALCVLAKQA